MLRESTISVLTILAISFLQIYYIMTSYILNIREYGMT